MLIGWINRGDDATLTTDSEVSTLPASNVQDTHVAKAWHTAAGVKSAYLIFDLGSSLACAAVAVLGTNLTSTATIQIRASDADATVTGTLLYDSGSISAGVDNDYGAIYKSFASQAARYWRIDFADASVPDNLQIGRVFLGPTWQPSVNMELGASWHFKDDSPVEKSWGGQTFPDPRPQTRIIEFTLGFMEEAEMVSNALALARRNGRVKDLLVIPDPTSSYLSQEAVFGLITETAPLVNYDLGVYRIKYSIEERL